MEKYTQIYDNMWTDAYAELTEEHTFSEYQATQVLLEILTVMLNKTRLSHISCICQKYKENDREQLRFFDA